MFFRNKQSHLKCLDNSAGLECNPYKIEVVGSNPAQGTRSFFCATGNFLGHELIIEGGFFAIAFSMKINRTSGSLAQLVE